MLKKLLFVFILATGSMSFCAERPEEEKPAEHKLESNSEGSRDQKFIKYVLNIHPFFFNLMIIYAARITEKLLDIDLNKNQILGLLFLVPPIAVNFYNNVAKMKPGLPFLIKCVSLVYGLIVGALIPIPKGLLMYKEKRNLMLILQNSLKTK